MSSPLGRLLHLCYNLDMARGKGLEYGSSTLVLALSGFQYFGTAFSEALERLCGGGGRHQQEPEGQMKKASSIFACRQGRHLRLGRISSRRAAGIYCFPARGTSGRLDAQLPPPIASSAASASEQAFSRELLRGLTRDTVLAAVPWLRFSPKAQH